MGGWFGARGRTLQHDRDETLREQVLLWALVAAVSRADGLSRSHLDDVLAGRTLGPTAIPSQRRHAR